MAGPTLHPSNCATPRGLSRAQSLQLSTAGIVPAASPPTLPTPGDERDSLEAPRPLATANPLQRSPSLPNCSLVRTVSPLPTPPASPQLPPPCSGSPPSLGPESSIDRLAALRITPDSFDNMRRIDSGVDMEDSSSDSGSRKSREKREEEFCWTVATTQGYRLVPSTSIFATTPYVAKPLHDHFEDVHWPRLARQAHQSTRPRASTDSAGRSPSPASRRQEGVLSGLVGLLRTTRNARVATPEPSCETPVDPSNPPPSPTTPNPLDFDSRSVSSNCTTATSSALQTRHQLGHSSLHPLTGHPYSLFILADGHGGHGAAEHLVPRMRDEVARLLESRAWEFSADAEGGADLSDAGCGRAAWRRAVEDVFERLDDDYCARKVREFSEHKRATAAHQAALAAAQAGGQPSIYTARQQTMALRGSPKPDPLPALATPAPKKPADDGCTMVVNVVYRGWLTCANLGDSRTIVARRRYRLHGPFPAPAFRVHFHSVDHSPTHPPSVHHVLEKGGIFISENGTPRRFHPPPLDPRDHRDAPAERKERYAVLQGARVYRTLNDEMRDNGVSNLKTLNLLGSLGDVGFKVGGRGKVIRSKPDVSFVGLRKGLVGDHDEELAAEEDGEVLEGEGPIAEEYLYVSATDGMWDHMRLQHSDMAQCDAVVAYASERLSSLTSGERERDRSDEAGELESLAIKLADRERTRELYIPNVPRVDDITVVVGLGRWIE